MPQAIPAIVTFFTSSAWYYVLARAILINVALGALSKALTKRPKTSAPPINITVKNTIENRRLIFGRTVRAGGTFVFYATSSTGGSTRDILWYVVVYSGHQVSAITDIWLDTERVPAADIHPTTGAVSTTKFSGKLNIWKYLGTSSQTVQSDLDTAIAEWTSNHRLLGCSYVVVKMQRSDSAFPSGAPQSVTALIDGAPMYDPRLDSTNGGSGSHRASNPSTWTPSANPALITRWYLTGGSVHNDLTTRLIMYGLREPESRIDDAYVRAAANICDESISGGNAPPSGAQARYACNLEVSTGEDRRDIFTAILAAMAGTLTYVHGKWRVYAGAYDTPLHSFTQDDLYGDLEVEDTTSHPERYNQVAAVYIDSSAQYQEATTIFRTDSAYEAQDGGEEIPREIELRGVTDQYQAQRLCEIELRKSRMMRTIKMRGSLNLLKVALNETFTLSHARYSWTSRVFRCIAREFEFAEDAGRVVLTARREDAGVYTDMLTADYTTGVSATDVFQLDAPDAPSGLIAEAQPFGIHFSWQHSVSFRAGVEYVLYEYTSVTPFSSATEVWVGTTLSMTLRRLDTTLRYYWIAARMHGALSTETPSGSGLAAAAIGAWDDGRPICPDKSFALATDDSHWKIVNSTSGATHAWSISLTGGVSEGYGQLVFDGSHGVNSDIYPNRIPAFRAVTGQAVEVTCRFRRTTAINHATLDIYLNAVLATTEDPTTGSLSASTLLSAAGSDRQLNVGGVNVNEWQEIRAIFRLQNQPKNTTQHPYLRIIVTVSSNTAVTSGTIQFDMIDARIVGII